MRHPIIKTLMVIEVVFIAYAALLPTTTDSREKHWVESPPLPEYHPVKPLPARSIDYGSTEYPEYYSPSAGHWEEALEDMDMLGIDPFSSDGEEYYELNYGN